DPPYGCVQLWLAMTTNFVWFPEHDTRPGRSGRPHSPLGLRGSLRALVRVVERAREPVKDAGVVSPVTCAALMLWLDVIGDGASDAGLPSIDLILPKLEAVA